MKFFLETERLLLRQLEINDAGFMVELLNSEGWLEYIGDRNVSTEEDAKSYIINGPIESYATNGFGILMVVLKDGNIPIGTCGLLKRDYLDDPDIGFAFLGEYTGKGYGYESAKAIINYAKTDLGILKLFAFTVPHNTASISLLKKLDFHFEKTITMPGENEELLLFSHQ